MARISTQHGLALERLSRELDRLAIADTPTVVEVDPRRAVLQLLTHDISRAARSVDLLAPPDAYPLLAPALRRPVSAGASVELYCVDRRRARFPRVEVIPEGSVAGPGCR